MADNTVLNTGAGGDTIASDDIAGVKYPRSKIVIGADGTNDGDVSAANPLPVTGTVTANLSATDNAVLDAIAASVAGAIPAGSNNIGDVDVLTINGVAPAFGAGAIGSTVQRVTIATGDDTHVLLASIDSVANTTTTPLGSAATFTGTGELNEFPDVIVSCITDNPGILYFEFSVNDIDWNTFPSAGFNVASGIHEFHRAVKGNRYFRVRFVNDTGAQSYLRLYTYYGHYGPLSAPLNQALSNDSDAIAVKSVMSGADPNGTFVNIGANQFGAMQVGPEQRTSIDSMDATTGWAALGNDTINLATTTKHVTSTLALTFDKTNGAANTVFAGIEKTLSAINLGTVSQHDILATTCYLPTITDVNYVFLRLGTSASHYNEWRIPVANLTAATFQILIFKVSDANYAGITGDGWNPTAVTYCAVGVAFNAETDALAGLVFDNISFHTNLHTSAVVNSEVTTSISSSNVNVFRVGGVATATNAGNVSNGTQRVTLANNDPAVIALQSLDNAISGNEMQVDIVAALPAGTNNIGDVDVLTINGVAPAFGTGARGATVQRVTIATDDIVPASQSGTWTVQPGNTPNTTAWLVTDKPVTSGGLSTYSFISTAAVQSANIKASAGMIYSVEFFNVSATPVFVRMYNTATANDGSGTPIERWVIPGNTAGAGFVKEWVKGIECGTGISIRVTGAIADADTTALAANVILGNVEYK